MTRGWTARHARGARNVQNFDLCCTASELATGLLQCADLHRGALLHRSTDKAGLSAGGQAVSGGPRAWLGTSVAWKRFGKGAESQNMEAAKACPTARRGLGDGYLSKHLQTSPSQGPKHVTGSYSNVAHFPHESKGCWTWSSTVQL